MEIFKPGSFYIDFMGKKNKFLVISLIAVLLSIGVVIFRMATDSMNWGIDFAGGTVINIEFEKNVDLGKVRKTVEKLGYQKSVIQRSAIQGEKGSVEYIIRVERIAILSETDAVQLESGLKEIFSDKFSELVFSPDSADQFELRFAKQVSENEVNDALKSMADKINKEELAEITIKKQGKEDENRYLILVTGVAAQIQANMQEAFPEARPLLRKVEFVGSQVGKKLRNDGILALIYALSGILVYTAFRFQFKFAPGAVVCLIHDAIITIGLFALLQLEFNLTFVAAVLTIVGYSINDTIVVYDRIRENLSKIRSMDMATVINNSLNETLSRTILTSLLTELSLVGLLLLGFGEIQQFAIAMTFGIVVGTYSTIFVACALTLFVENRIKKLQTA